MSINYPTSLDSLSNPSGGDALNSNGGHALQHANANDAIEALEAKVGANSSTVSTSHDYKLSAVTGTDKAVSKTGTEVLTNKTLTSPSINLSSNATGDMYYRDSGGVFQRLPIGTTGQIIDVSAGGIPEWIANPSASNASTTVKGVVEIATTAEITAGTSTGGTGAVLVITADAVGAPGASKLVQYTAGGLYPVADGSNITNIGLGATNLNNIPNTIPTNTSIYHTYQSFPLAYHDGANYRMAGFLSTFTSATGDEAEGGGGSFYLSITGSGSMVSRIPGIAPNVFDVNLNFSQISTNPISLKYRVQIRGTGTSPTYGFGLSQTAAGTYGVYNSTALDTVRFVYDGTTMRATSSKNGVGVTNTTVSVTTTSWNIYEIVVSSTQNLFYVNGILVATHTTNIPVGATAVYHGWGITCSGTAGDMVIAPAIISIPTS